MKKRILALLCAVMLLLCGCSVPEQASADQTSAPQPKMMEPPAAASAPGPELTGALLDEQGEIPSEVELLIGRYMELYYSSIASLRLCPLEEVSSLFAADAQAQALGNHTVWNYLIQTRLMQPTDLSMKACRYLLSCLDCRQQEDGSLRLILVEESVQNFAAHPGVDSELFGIYHLFTAKQQDGEWVLSSHLQMDSLYFTLFGEIDESRLTEHDFKQSPFPEENAQAFFEERLKQRLTIAREHFASRTNEPFPMPEADNAYDCAAAVEYAHLHAQERSQDWDDYGRYGGNCQNFVSQCLLAGGIPMDIRGNYIWKWYGTTPNEYNTAAGRSAAWSSVESFREYVVGNRGGFGLVAEVDAPYFSGQEGDLLEMGPGGDVWKHTVIITGLVKDDRGNTVDYLVDSNTADLRNYPAGAYSYTDLSLVRIAGWNH